MCNELDEKVNKSKFFVGFNVSYPFPPYSLLRTLSYFRYAINWALFSHFTMPLTMKFSDWCCRHRNQPDHFSQRSKKASDAKIKPFPRCNTMELFANVDKFSRIWLLFKLYSWIRMFRCDWMHLNRASVKNKNSLNRKHFRRFSMKFIEILLNFISCTVHRRTMRE